MEELLVRHADKIQGTLSCLDRVVLTGTIPGICYAEGMGRLLGAQGIRLFGYPRWAEPLRDEISAHAQRLAQANGLEIEFIRKKTHKTYLKTLSSKCLHYYFYFIRADLGLCYLRVPTWAPFRLQLYYNGHNELAAKLQAKGIGFQRLDNAFIQIDRFAQAQKLADDIGGRYKAQTASSATGRDRQTILAGPSSFSQRLPLESEAGRIRHRR